MGEPHVMSHARRLLSLTLAAMTLVVAASFSGGQAWAQG